MGRQGGSVLGASVGSRSVWEACRFGDLARLEEIRKEEGVRALGQRHPVPDHLKERAVEEAQWSNYRGQKQVQTFRGGGWTPLHVAAAFGQTEVVRWLLRHQVAPDGRDTYRRLSKLDQSSASISKRVSDKRREEAAEAGWTALHWAGHTARLELLKVLLEVTSTSESNRDLLCEILQFTTTPKSKNELGEDHSSDASRLLTWGSGTHFALGNGIPGNRSTPCPVQGTMTSDGFECSTHQREGEMGRLSVKICATSKYYTLAACVDPDSGEASLWAWGLDKEGCLGLGKEGGTVPLPTQVSLATESFTCLSIGPAHSCVVTSEGHLFTFGSEIGRAHV